MTTAHEQAVKDEADAERRHQAAVPSRTAVPPAQTHAPRRIKLTPLTEDEAAGVVAPAGTPYVQTAIMDPVVKQVFEALIAEIRGQVMLKPEAPPDVELPKPPEGGIKPPGGGFKPPFGDKPGPG